MKKLHRHLESRYDWYSEWHKKKIHNVIHLGVFLVAGAFLATVIYQGFNTSSVANADVCEPSTIPDANGNLKTCHNEIMTAFRNPGKGWLMYNFSPTDPNKTVLSTPLSSALYTNDIYWSDLEPTEGNYRWDYIDALITKWKGQAEVRVGLMMGAPFSRHSKDPIPDWVKSQITGAYLASPDIWEPTYTHPVFKQKYTNFINAFANRYYNTPSSTGAEDWQKHLGSVDISTYGTWGEWWSSFPWRVERAAIGTFVNSTLTNGPILFSFDDLSITSGSTPVITDDFTRNLTGKWGSATTGGAYSTAADATAVDFNINGQEGTLSNPAGGSRKAVLASISEHDIDVKVKVKTDKIMVGGSSLFDLKTRQHNPEDATYASRMLFQTNGTFAVVATKVVNGVSTTLSAYTTVPGITHTPDTFYWFRTKVSGQNPTTIQIKLWQDGTSEPSAWNYTITDNESALGEDYGHEKYVTLKSFVDIFLDAFSGSVKPELMMNLMGSSGNPPSTLEDADVAAVKYAVEQGGAHMVRRMIGWGDGNLKPDEIEYIEDHLDTRKFQGEWAKNTMAWFDSPTDNTPRKYTYEAIDQALGLGASLLGYYVTRQYIPCSIIPEDIPLEELPEKDQCIGNPTGTIFTYPFLKLYPGTNETLESYFQRRSGYRFFVSESVYPDQVVVGQNFTLDQEWYQRAVAKLYKEYNLRAYLVNATERIALNTDTSSLDAHTWNAGPSGPHSVSSDFSVPSSTPLGTYNLEFAVVDGEGNPAMNLAIEGKNTTGLTDPINDYAYYTVGTINVVAPDTTLPIVSITEPLESASVSGTVTISADATDAGGISKVEFYADGSLFATDTSNPYSASWDTSSYAGGTSHSLSAKVYDDSDNVGDSIPVNVTVTDVIAPTVSITAPQDNANVSGIVTINATATDASGVSKVEFYIDGVLSTTDTSSPYTTSWDTTPYIHNSNHTLVVKAYDGANNMSTSSTVIAKVLDVTLPTVSITSPTNTSQVTRSTTVTISATAADTSGISKVEFYVNNVLKCTDTSTPYSCAWAVPAPKNVVYTLTAKAYDVANNVKTSTNVTVTSK